MTLPVSGPLSLLQIQGEFGGTAPISLSEYYKGAGHVTQYSNAPHVPYSGPIKISDFYGASQYVPQPRSVTLYDGQTFVVPSTIASGITATLLGASGGNGGNDVDGGWPGYGGHLVSGTFSVSPGGTILASVGGPGVSGGSGAGPGTQGQGGYGGVLGYYGGYGGGAGYAGWSGGGGGGGGASVVTYNGTPAVVAGGGGGGGGGGWHSNGRPSQGYVSTGVPQGGQGQDKWTNGSDGGGGGGGGGGYWGGAGGACVDGDEGAWSGSDGADLVPPGGSVFPFSSTPIYNVGWYTWCDFLNTYGVWVNPDGVDPVGSWVEVNYVVAIPTTGSYLLRVSGDNHVRVYIYGNLVGSNDDWVYYNDSTVGINAGVTTIVVNGLNDGGPAGFAAALYDLAGNLVWSTRSANTSAVTIQGVW